MRRQVGHAYQPLLGDQRNQLQFEVGCSTVSSPIHSLPGISVVRIMLDSQNNTGNPSNNSSTPRPTVPPDPQPTPRNASGSDRNSANAYNSATVSSASGPPLGQPPPMMQSNAAMPQDSGAYNPYSMNAPVSTGTQPSPSQNMYGRHPPVKNDANSQRRSWGDMNAQHQMPPSQHYPQHMDYQQHMQQPPSNGRMGPYGQQNPPASSGGSVLESLINGPQSYNNYRPPHEMQHGAPPQGGHYGGHGGPPMVPQTHMEEMRTAKEQVLHIRRPLTMLSFSAGV